MIFITEDLDFDNLTSDQFHHLVPEKPLEAFCWDTPASPLPIVDYDLKGYREIVKSFYQRLTLLRCARNTAQSPTDTQIEDYTRYLVENQRNDPELHFGHGSWTVPEDTAIPGDAAVDFAFVPSYLAVAWLVLVKERHSDVALRVQGLDASLRRGLRFIFTKDLKGAGHEANRDLLNAVDYLSLGMVFSFVVDQQERFPRLAEKVRAIEASIKGKLANATGFSATDLYSRQRALELIRGGDRDDSLVCPPVWHQWQLSQSAWAYNRVLEIAPPIAAGTIFPLVKQAAVDVVPQLREAFDEVKPKHAVFGQRRQVTSDPVELTLNVSFDSSIESAIEQVGVVPWVSHLSSQGFMKVLNQSFISRLSYEINDRFNDAEEFSGEEFSINVSKIERHQEGYRFHICATG
ncbi:hypothetical protein [Marinobacter qingdaonensis]|uniref:Uncharacterized protein n=1 Tax=Marinobacter qingdaonensis TaxID=3108486 RepID=A0ABU5NYI4_9GAMM|nr:hypothetical protein [Marinobacter sp. ASW11-75]MEA1080860.1 hypothetical protein [Marinobacter sp. ASW11-75]